jgi:STE24 endopeptidase
LPLDYFHTFKIENDFGFNRSTIPLWITDRLKNILVGALIQIPLMASLFYVLQTFPKTWWLLGTIGMIVLQMIALWLYPKLILPLFNKLTPLDEGSLKTRLTLLAQKAGFSSTAIQILDSSKRSSHSNAYCSSFGKIQHIVLYDTLLKDFTDAEIEAIVAHEIGHYKRKHLVKLLMLYALLTFGILKGCDAVLHCNPLAQAFANPTMSPLLLLTLLITFSEWITYWFKPIFNRVSRKYEYEADAFAGQQSPTCGIDLIRALKKLYRTNASNLFPHPLYSAFHYSHPTLSERERALKRCSEAL